MAGLSLSLGLGLGPSGGGAAPSAFSPAELFSASEPGAWYDPSDFSTMFQDSSGTIPITAVGQPVGRINDKSGRGNAASQETAGSRPILQQDGAGNYYLLFDGVDDSLVTQIITPGIDKAQLFTGVRKLSDATTAILVEMSSSTTSNNGSLAILAPFLPNEYTFRSKGTIISASNIDNLAYAAPVTSVLTGLGDISGDSSILRINGAQVGSSATDQGSGNFLAYPLYVGRRGGTEFPFNGRVYGMIVRFGANLTADKITQTEAWLNAKTGAY